MPAAITPSGTERSSPATDTAILMSMTSPASQSSARQKRNALSLAAKFRRLPVWRRCFADPDGIRAISFPS